MSADIDIVRLRPDLVKEGFPVANSDSVTSNISRCVLTTESISPATRGGPSVTRTVTSSSTRMFVDRVVFFSERKSAFGQTFAWEKNDQLRFTSQSCLIIIRVAGRQKSHPVRSTQTFGFLFYRVWTSAKARGDTGSHVTIVIRSIREPTFSALQRILSENTILIQCVATDRQLLSSIRRDVAGYRGTYR